MRKPLLALGVALAAGAVLGPALVSAQNQKTTVRVFLGSTLRRDVLEPIFQRFERANPNIAVAIETGGATSDQQNQYLSTIFAARDASLDVFAVDVIRPAQYAAAGWAEPLEKYMSEAEKAEVQNNYLAGPAQAGVVNGQRYSLPMFTDTQFLYYRRDLLEKHGAKVPRTWEELTATAQRILAAEKDPNLQGLNFQGARIEGAVCTFLQPFWAAGGELVTNGRVTVDSAAGRKALTLLVDSINRTKISPASLAEATTDLSRQQFQNGNVLFGLQWAYGWGHFQGTGPQPSKVKGLVGVAALPAFQGGRSANCVGGWHWMLNAYGRQKEAAYRLVKYMSGVDAQTEYAVKTGNLPVRKSLYNSPAVLRANPHFKDLYPVILRARPRPVTPNYEEFTQGVRGIVNAVVGGSKPVDAALKELQAVTEKALR